MGWTKDDGGTYYLERSWRRGRVRAAVTFSPTLWTFGPRVEWEGRKWIGFDLGIGPVALVLLLGGM